MKSALSLLLFTIASIPAFAVSRFPKPEFDSNYKYPVLATPETTSAISLYIAIGLLILALAVSTYFALKKRSRKGILAITIFSLLFFGFYRHGCLCVVGSLQNVAMATFNSGYALPFAVVLLFLLPLVVALFFGRIFCASVCPLGAIQEVMAVKPQQLPAWLEHILGLIPYIYFSLAILYAATGSAFIICNYDPFVVFFRLDGTFPMVIAGILFLITGIFIARPYCRFFCPYSVLLRWTSYFSKYHVTVTPDECVQCRLCETACPVGAIRKPLEKKLPESRAVGRKRLATLIFLLPVFALTFGWGVSRLNKVLSRLDRTVRLAEQIHAEEVKQAPQTTLQSRTFHASGTSKNAIYYQAQVIQSNFRTGGWLIGIFLGLVFGFKLISLSVRNPSPDYEPDRMKCISCARCFDSCPKSRR